jgi:ABC-type nitrate/sulfonate/bicarbonate transport system permease component
VTADPTFAVHDGSAWTEPHRRQPGKLRKTGTFPPFRGLLPLAGLLGIWQLAGPQHSPYFPRPSTWAQALMTLWRRGTLGPAAAATLGTFLVALTGATVVGVVVGIVVGTSRPADGALGPSLEFARAMPPAAMVPIAVLLIGYDATMKVTVVVFATIWPVLLNTRAGVRFLDPILADTARSLHLNPVDRVRKCVLPALYPSIFLGVRSAVPVALVMTLLVELVTQVNGLGALIGISQRSYQSAAVYGLLLVAALFSMAVNGLAAAVETYALRHRPQQ